VEIFIGNLPDDIGASDLQTLLNSTLRENIFDKLYDRLVTNGSLSTANTSYRIVQKEIQGQVVQYGHIDIRSKKLANVAITVLDNANFNGSDLIAREYIHRAYINDRRDTEWRESPWRNDERRLFERRYLEGCFF